MKNSDQSWFNYYSLKESITQKPISIQTSPTPNNFSDTIDIRDGQMSINDSNINNAFAYVLSLLAPVQYPIKQSNSSKSMNTNKSKQNNSSYKQQLLPSITWRNATKMKNKTHSKTSSKRGKIVVDQVMTSLFNLTSNSNNSNISNNTQNYVKAYGEGGGYFSCLVEVQEPECECGWSTAVKVAGATGVAGINEFPSMAGVMTAKYNKIYCGASISK